MTKELTEAEFVELFSETQYRQLVSNAYSEIKQTPEFKNNEPYCHSFVAFDCHKKDGSKWTIIIETTAKKIVNGMCDFGITKMILSDEEMPDEALDRLMEFMKQEEIDKKIKK